MQVLALVRNFVPSHRQVLEGRWDIAEIAADAHDLEGKTVGVVGAGRIASVLLRLRPRRAAPLPTTVGSRRSRKQSSAQLRALDQLSPPAR
jgi:phosphoglycerate dehydrogenase-like enzyme